MNTALSRDVDEVLGTHRVPPTISEVRHPVGDTRVPLLPVSDRGYPELARHRHFARGVNPEWRTTSTRRAQL